VTKFVPAGPKRYKHQLRGLRKLIETQGIAALLYEPGLGKSATVLDFLSILALKAQPSPIDGVPEARALVICPLAAVDTWVKQAGQWMHPDVDFWAEAVGGKIVQRAETLATRGGWYGKAKPRRISVAGKREVENMRAYGWHRAIDVATRGADGTPTPLHFGPSALGDAATGRPRLILEVVNTDTFSSRSSAGSRTTADTVVDAIDKYAPDIVVVDESHTIKGPSSNRSRLIARVGRRVPRRVILTGTVMPQGPLDVYAQWRFLDPTAFGDRLPNGQRSRATLDGFRRQFAVMGGWQGQEVVGYRNLEKLQRIMGERAVVATKATALDLPPVTSVVVPVILSPAEKKAYQEMKKNLATKLVMGQLPGVATTAPTAPAATAPAPSLPSSAIQLSDGSWVDADGKIIDPTKAAASPTTAMPTRSSVTAKSRLTQMLRLRQITAGHLPDDLGVVHTIGDSKVRTIASIVNDTLAGEKRVVVFCLFRHEFHELMDTLKKDKGSTVLGISGDTPSHERIAYRRRFGRSVEDEPARIVLIAQVMTLNLSVNELVTAQNVVFASLPQQRDVLVQAIDRLNRIGQKNSVTAWFAEAPGTVDTVIHHAHDDRTSLEEAVLRHVMADEDPSIVQEVLGTAAVTPQDPDAELAS